MGLKVNKNKSKGLEKLIVEEEPEEETEEIEVEVVEYGDGKTYYWDNKTGKLYDEDEDEVDGLSDLYDDIVEEFDLMVIDAEPPTPKKKKSDEVDDEDEITVVEFKYKGKKYLKDENNNVYNFEGEEIGKLKNKKLILS